MDLPMTKMMAKCTTTRTGACTSIPYVYNENNNIYSAVGSVVSDNSSTTATTTTTTSSTTTTTTGNSTSTRSKSIRIDDIGKYSCPITRDIEDRYLFDTEQARIRDYEMFNRIERGRCRAQRLKDQTTKRTCNKANSSTMVSNHSAAIAPLTITFPLVVGTCTELMTTSDQHHHHHQTGVVGIHNPNVFDIQHSTDNRVTPTITTSMTGPCCFPIHPFQPLHGYQFHPLVVVPSHQQLQQQTQPFPVPVPVQQLSPMFAVNTNPLVNVLRHHEEQPQQQQQKQQGFNYQTTIQEPYPNSPCSSSYSDGIFQLDL